jgi:hypothetical protein
MFKVLAVAALITVLLVVSIAPALAVPRRFGQPMPTDKPCDVAKKLQKERDSGAHLVFDPTEEPAGTRHTGCWLVLPGQEFSTP